MHVTRALIICSISVCAVFVCVVWRQADKGTFVFMAVKEWVSKYRLPSHIKTLWKMSRNLRPIISHTHTHAHTATRSDTHTLPHSPPHHGECVHVQLNLYLRQPNMPLLACMWVCECVRACDIRFLHNRWDRLCVIRDWVKYHVFSLKSVINPHPPALPATYSYNTVRYRRPHSVLIQACPAFSLSNAKH